MVLWRISIFNDMVGLAGELSKGRWHTPAEGRRIVYLAEHPALALVESLVNLKIDSRDRPEAYQLLRAEAAAEIPTETVAERALPQDWRERFEITQELGNSWLERVETALLAVPSAQAPESTNYLLNPNHPDAAALKIAWARWLRYDGRFFRVSA